MSEPTLGEIKELILELKQGGKVLLNAMQTLSADIQNLDTKLGQARILIIALRDITKNLEALIELVKAKTDILPTEFTRAGASYKVK